MSDDNGHEGERRTKLVKAGVAVGVGSAALVAALLYASTIKKKPAKRAPYPHKNKPKAPDVD